MRAMVVHGTFLQINAKFWVVVVLSPPLIEEGGAKTTAPRDRDLMVDAARWTSLSVLLRKVGASIRVQLTSPPLPSDLHYTVGLSG